MEKYIIFDLFDTLGKGDRGELEPYFTREIDRQGDIGNIDSRETIDILVQENPSLLDIKSRDEWVDYYENQMKKCITDNVQPGIVPMLQDLKQEGYTICVVSDAAKADIAKWDESEISKCVDCHVFSCDEHIIKPDSRLLDIARERMGCSKDDLVVYSGDGGHDELKMAQEDGMVTVKANYYKNRRDDDITQFADRSAATPHDVVEHCQEIYMQKTMENRQFSTHVNEYGEPEIFEETGTTAGKEQTDNVQSEQEAQIIEEQEQDEIENEYDEPDIC